MGWTPSYPQSSKRMTTFGKSVTARPIGRSSQKRVWPPSRTVQVDYSQQDRDRNTHSQFNPDQLQAEIRRLQHDLEMRRLQRLESSESLLQDVRSKLEGLQVSVCLPVVNFAFRVSFLVCSMLPSLARKKTRKSSRSSNLWW